MRVLGAATAAAVASSALVSTPRIGQVLGDRYEITAVIGRGGQSTVYRARDRIDGDEVAIKLVHGALGDPDVTERIFREAQSMSQLLGTAAVRILHQVRTPEGALGLVMELLEGKNLEQHLTELEARGERATARWIEATLAPIVATLTTMHDRGLVHRDLKPENIFVLDDAKGGGVRLIDFGFVKLLRSPSITGQELLAGAPPYIAPETWLAGAWSASVQSDVYSLSVILFRVVAGHLPFDGASIVEQMQLVTTAPRPKLHDVRPDLSPDIDAWVEQALAIDRNDRFASVNAAWRALLTCFSS